MFVKLVTGTIEFIGYNLGTLSGNYLLIFYKNSLSIIAGYKTNPIFIESNLNMDSITDKDNEVYLFTKQDKKSSKLLQIKVISSEENTLPINKVLSDAPHKKVTEFNVRDIIANRYALQGYSVQTEYQTPYGIIDILCKKDNEILIIEVKKEYPNLSAISQCLRYVTYFEDLNSGIVKGFIASTKVSQKIKLTLKENGLNYIGIE